MGAAVQEAIQLVFNFLFRSWPVGKAMIALDAGQ